VDEKELARSKDFVQSLGRGLSIMKIFSAENPRLTLSEVAELTGYTRATARRFLLTLESLGYVGSTERHFYLKSQVLTLGYAYLSSFSLGSIAQMHLEELSADLRESCSASVLEGENVIYVCRVTANRIRTINLAVGTQLPAYCTSMGRVLLASMKPAEIDSYFANAKLEKLTSKTVVDEAKLRTIVDEVRKNGYSIVSDELEEGLESVSVPIHSRDGKVLAAANISAHATRVSFDKLQNEFLPKLQKAVKEIEKALAMQS
jgi:IclR family pca regulon transcriptional regulator